MKTVFTVAMPYIEGRLLLGFKKTKIGKGYWNGFGGRVEAGETVAEAAARELLEESGLTAHELSLSGVVTANFRDVAEQFELNIFRVTRIGGEARETREMRPQWFAVDQIPYEAMWASDKLWLPLLLAGKQFSGTVWFDNLESRQLLKAAIRERVNV
jgi:8-oxo-dGTP pyrophosphatase MutT (NUDIX family)